MYNRYKTERKAFQTYNRLAIEMTALAVFVILFLTYGNRGETGLSLTIYIDFTVVCILAMLLRAAKLILNFITELEHDRHELESPKPPPLEN